MDSKLSSGIQSIPQNTAVARSGPEPFYNTDFCDSLPNDPARLPPIPRHWVLDKKTQTNVARTHRKAEWDKVNDLEKTYVLRYLREYKTMGKDEIGERVGLHGTMIDEIIVESDIDIATLSCITEKTKSFLQHRQDAERALRAAQPALQAVPTPPVLVPVIPGTLPTSTPLAADGRRATEVHTRMLHLLEKMSTDYMLKLQALGYDPVDMMWENTTTREWWIRCWP